MTASDSRLSDDPAEVEDISASSGRIRIALEITVALLVLVGIYYLFAPEEAIELPPPQGIDPIVRSGSKTAQQPPPLRESTPATAASTAGQLPESSTRASETAPRDAHDPSIATAQGDAARRLITELRDGGKTLAPEEILRQAEAYQQSGKPADAYLLLFYAARHGDARAAFTLATLNDPNHFKSGLTPLPQPDISQARKWYGVAASQGIAEAAQRLRALRQSLEIRASDGDAAARRLLLGWPET